MNVFSDRSAVLLWDSHRNSITVILMLLDDLNSVPLETGIKAPMAAVMLFIIHKMKIIRSAYI